MIAAARVASSTARPSFAAEGRSASFDIRRNPRHTGTRASGETLAAIASAAALSDERIRQILREQD